MSNPEQAGQVETRGEHWGLAVVLSHFLAAQDEDILSVSEVIEGLYGHHKAGNLPEPTDRLVVLDALDLLEQGGYVRLDESTNHVYLNRVALIEDMS